jgi:hypothetical protein
MVAGSKMREELFRRPGVKAYGWMANSNDGVPMLPAISLDQIRVASPCHASWSSMHGDDRVRFCSLCQKNVYNLSTLPAAEIQTLIQEHVGRLCVRFYQRADGTMIIGDCPVGLWRARCWLGGIVAALVATCFAAALFMNDSARRPLTKKEVFSRLREIEPLEPVIEWLDPTPPPRRLVMGALPLLPPPRENQAQPPGAQPSR